MKRLLTFFAFLMCVLGAKAEWTPVYEMDYSNYEGFPYFVMSYVPEWNDGIMTDYGAQYSYKTEDQMVDFTGGTEVGTVTTAGGTIYHKVLLDSPSWHQYFIADGIPTQMGGHYKVVAKAKASEAATINVNMGWGWGAGQQMGGSVAIPQSDDFVEVEWEYDGIGGTSCNLVAQPGSCTETIEWQSVTVYEWQRGNQKPIEWVEMLSNGDAETPWGNLANVRYDDLANNSSVCAWAKEIGRNVEEGTEDDYGRELWHPFPADIMEEDGNYVFVAHAAQGAVNGWDNEFWIMSPQPLRTGTKLKLHFRYKASQNVSTGTQFHRYPSSYMYWGALGDIKFSTEWQEYDGTITVPSDANGAQALEFTLNIENLYDAIDFYFDDLSWQTMKLDEGYFISGINTNIATKYEDLDNAIEFEDGEDTEGTPCLVATVGKQGDEDSYVNQVMISTTRGDNGAFMASTLKPAGQIKNDPTVWLEYSPSNLAKLDLPGLGVWTVYLDEEYNSMAFQMIEGVAEEEKEPVDVVTNPTEITVHGQEREYTEYEAEELGIEKPDNPGQAWDNLFWIVANRVLEAGEETVVEFDYVANKNASTLTQTHGAPSAYVHWAAIGDVNFDTEWQHFEREFTIPAEAADRDAQSIAFCMAVIKEACNYTITNVRWYVKSDMEGMTYENLIDAEGTKNFYVKEGAGTSPRVYDPSGEIVTPTVWTIAGSSEIFGSYWDPSDTRNDMKQIKEGIYVLEKKNVSLKEGGLYEFKVVANHSWDINYGAGGERNGYNVQFTVEENGTYNLYFYFYENENHQLGYGLEFLKGEIQGELAEVYSIDYSDYKGFPFYVLSFVPEFDNGCMRDYGAMYMYKTDADVAEEDNVIGTVTTETGTVYEKIELGEPGWHQYFIGNGIPTELGGRYVVKAMVRASDPCYINVNMGDWSKSLRSSVFIYDDWTEIEWEYDDMPVTSAFLIAQPGMFTGTIDWQWLKVYKVQQGEEHPVEWIEMLTNGDAETPWEEMGLADVRWNDEANNYKVSAWGRVKGENIDYDTLLDKENWCPFPATIEVDPDNAENHVFVVHATTADSMTDDGDTSVSAWDNQFWIQSPKEWKTGDMVRIQFRYKASQDAKASTQAHKQTPMSYLHWQAVGDVHFTTEWQEFDGIMTIGDNMSGTWSIAFNLNTEVKDATDFYFDDLSWQAMKLDEGFFVAGANTKTGYPEYDLYNATAFEWSENIGKYVVTVGTMGDQNTWVDEVMISTVRGDDQAFRGHTIMPQGKVYNGSDEWVDFTEATNAKISLPGTGVWNIYIDTEYQAMAVEMLEGEEPQMLMGDVDSNGEVNVTDAVLIIDDILGRNPWNFNAEAADVNYDSYINVTDVVLVIDHVLGKVNLNRAAATDAEMGAISLSSDMKTVSLTNPSAYTAFQMDVTLPKGVSLEDVLLTERAARSHSVVIREMENGSYRIVGVSMKNDAFKGNVGDLLQLQLTGNAQGSVAIDNVLFVTPQGVQHELAGVNAFGDVTGISDALRLNDNGQLINDNVFDLQGRQVNNAQLKKGLYILNGKKQVVK